MVSIYDRIIFPHLHEEERKDAQQQEYPESPRAANHVQLDREGEGDQQIPVKSTTVIRY